MRILFLSRWYPWPRDNGAKLRNYGTLTALGRCHDVTLIAFREPGQAVAAGDPVHKICREVRVVERKPFNPVSARAILGLFSAKPRSVFDTRSLAMEITISQTLAADRFDCVVASEVDMAAYRPLFRGVPAMFDGLEVALYRDRYRRSPSRAAKVRRGLTWFKQRRYVATLLSFFDHTTVPSALELELARGIAGDDCRITVAPNAIDLAEYSNPSQDRREDSLIFMGAFSYEPNYQGMRWFQEYVCPLLAAKRPGLRVVVTGSHGDRRLNHTEYLHLTGWVDDIRPLVAQASCCIAPLLEGGGTRLKILEAMALRTPVVSTSKGAEGLDFQHGEHLLIADSPSEFAAAVDLLLASPQFASDLAERAHKRLAELYDARIVGQRLVSLVEELGGGSRAAADSLNATRA